ncbi:MAG: tellurite resistance TerB family protein, partial [Candidatus Competibacteraceae bacterium]|nr:tellurite resistance TerB family protein [Candidatus Competibacteraceae bacterium]
TPPPGQPVGELQGPVADRRSLALLKAIIAAAKADGHIDAEEQQKIEAQIARFGLDNDTLTMLQKELEKPLNPADIAAGADSPEAAAEIYLASLLVINVDNFMERAYLDELARLLGLAPDLVAQLEAEAGH